MKKLKTIIGIIISVVLIYLVFRKVEFKRLADTLLGINYLLIIPAVGIQLLSYWVRTARWSVMLGSIKKIKTSRLFSTLCISYMANTVLPFRAGDILRSYLVGKKEDISAAAALSTVIVEKIYDGITLLLFMGGVSLLYPFPNSIKSLGIVVSAVFLGALLFTIFIVVFKEKTLKFIGVFLKILPSKLNQKTNSILTKLIDGFEIIKDVRSLLPVITYSIIIWLLEAFLIFTIAKAFGFSNTIYLALFTLVVANFGIMIPSAPGNLGTFEGATKAALSVFKIADNAALGFTLVYRVFLYLPVTVLGFIFFIKEGISFSAIKSMESEKR